MLLAASAVLCNPLVARASSTVAKKAFDAVARNALRGITDILTERFKGNAEVLKLRDELELKVSVLSLPVDICVQQALQGNSALQGALNVALKVLQDIEDFELNLQQQEIDLARGDSSGTPDKTSVSEAVKKLTSLIKQLDSLLPYLSVAISAVNLLNAGSAAPAVSPSRLMAASWQIRAAPTSPGTAVMALPQALWHRQGLVASASGRAPMQTLYPMCSITLQRPEEEEEVDSQSAALAHKCEYEICIQQDLDDGAYHEDEEQAGKQVVKVADIVTVEWATSHSLNLGSNDYSPALVLHALKPNPGLERRGSSMGSNAAVTPPSRVAPASPMHTPPASSSSSAARPHTGRSRSWSGSRSAPQNSQQVSQQKYALQCCAAQEGQQDVSTSQQWDLLSRFEYVLRLCMLESREDKAHHLIEDERIQMAFTSKTPAAPSLASSQQAASHTMPSPNMSSSTVFRQPDMSPETPDVGTDWKEAERAAEQSPSSAVSSLTRNLDNMAFGSPT